MKNFDTIIIGGGASGMVCALQLAARTGQSILLIERNDRLGKKLSATGNGQGNITNLHMDGSHYFTTQAEKVNAVLQGFDEQQVLSFFTSLGGLFTADAEGRVYPYSRQASSVTDLLRLNIESCKNISVLLSARVIDISRRNDRFSVRTEKETFFCQYAVLSVGGKAAKHFGTDGNGYVLAEKLGHTVSPLVPALVQLKTPLTFIRGMKGIRTDCILTLLHGEKQIKTVRGDVLFTDYGISGNAVFKISSFLMRSKNRVTINFMPDFTEEDVFRTLQRKAKAHPTLAMENLLCGIVNNAIARSLFRFSGLNLTDTCGDSGDRLRILVSALFSFPLDITDTLGFDYAQVTKGGILTEETDDNLMSLKCENLYFTGEILNVDGECGGYNLQWAFASAERCARAIAEKSAYADR